MAAAVKTIFTLFAIVSVIVADETAQCPNIIKRSQWGARAAGAANYLIVPLPYAIVHHTVTSTCSRLSQCAQIVANIQASHMDGNGWDDIGYSFLIGGDGNVYEGVGWTREGAHTYGYNKKSIGIAFIGSYNDDNASQKMIDTAQKLLLCGKSQGLLRSNVRLIGARQVSATISPGIALYNQIQALPEWVSVP